MATETGMGDHHSKLRESVQHRIDGWEERQENLVRDILASLADEMEADERALLLPLLADRLVRQTHYLSDIERLARHSGWHLLDIVHEYLTCREMDEKAANWPMGQLIQHAAGNMPEIKRVAYLGREGSWSWQQARRCFPHAIWQGVEDFDTAASMVASGQAEAAVLPIDNTTAGSINEVYDVLLASGLYIVSGSTLAIRNHLLGVSGTQVADILEVRSHPQPLKQCSERISRGNWKTIQMASTADAAVYVKETNNSTIAAIGSQDAAEFYGLEVLEENINDAAENQTRFITVMRAPVIENVANRISLAFVLPHACGSLAHVLGRIADLGLNLAKIQSRPIPGKPWEYHFYLDFIGTKDNPNTMLALYLLAKDIPDLRLLGWYEEFN